MDNKTFYDSLYRANQESQAFEIKSKEDVFKFLVKKAQLNFNRQVVLDLGFGTGNILEVLKKSGASCHGVEISATAIERLKNKGYQLKQVEDELLPYPDAYFDTVVSSHTLEHIPNELKVLQEIERVIKPGGLVIIGVPTGRSGINLLHFRSYSTNDGSRLATQLNAICIYNRNFGSRLFLFIYRGINSLIGLIFSGARPSQAEEISISERTEGSLLRWMYQQTIVKTLCALYRADMCLPVNEGMEIWYIFRKN